MSGSRVCKWSEKKDKGKEPEDSMHLRDEKLGERLSKMHCVKNSIGREPEGSMHLRDKNLHERRSSCKKQLLVS